MRIVFSKAKPGDAAVTAQIRRKVWETTYRGIYPDEEIDRFDYARHEGRDKARIEDSSFVTFLIRDADTDQAVGYLFFRDTGRVYVDALSVLPEYQRRGVGTAAFAVVRDYCRDRGLDSFSCDCNEHNDPARQFYCRMGGTVTAFDTGHVNRGEDRITYTFSV